MTSEALPPVRELLVEFRGATRERMIGAANALLLVPALSERALVAAALRWDAGSRTLSARLQLDAARFGARAAERVTFWCARAGGVLPPLTGDGDGAAAAAAAGPIVAPGELLPALERLCEAAGHSVSLAPPLAPLVVVHLAGPATVGMRYDEEPRRFFLPAPLAPPRGDVFVLEAAPPRSSRAPRARGFVRVEEVRPRAAAGPGRPAGFTVDVSPAGEPLHAVLSRFVRPSPRPCTRAAVRTRTALPARVDTPVAEAAGSGAAVLDDRVRDLSQGGAFVATTRRAPVGSTVRLSVRLPEGDVLETLATVARTTPEGMGVRFRLDAGADARLAQVLTRAPGRPHRVLVVDDDALGRRMLSDALAARGCEVLTAGDAEAGLHVLAEEILTLDALVTDVRMPGIDGAALVQRIRGPGGERELPIVAVSASVDAALRDRLLAAGVDRVLEKSAGADAVAEAALEGITLRSEAAAPLRVAK